MTIDQHTVHQLVLGVVYNKSYNGLDGLNPVRNLLWKDTDGAVAAYLEQEIETAPDKVRGGLAFILGAHYLQRGRLHAIRSLYTNGDPEVSASVLSSLTGEPIATPELGPGIVALGIEGLSHSAPDVRSAACRVLMNQCAWKVDVSGAINPILRLIDDTCATVRQSAASAIGNFARTKRYDLAAHILSLARRLHDENIYVTETAAWALWKLSANRDIASAVPELFETLNSQLEYDGPRKNAACALLSFARKCHQNRDQVRRLVGAGCLDTEQKEISRFMMQLSAM